MSWRATAWVNQVKGITRSEKLLLFVLSDRYNEDEGCARPSIPIVAEESLMSARTAQRVIASLQEKGKIKIHERPGKTSLYTFPGHSSGDITSLLNKLSGDKNYLPNNPTPVKINPNPRHPVGLRTEENRDDDEPIVDDAPASLIDTTQDILPWMQRRWEEHQATKTKAARKKFNPGPHAEQFERQEEALGREAYRREFLDYLSGPDNKGVVKFAMMMAPSSNGSRRPAAAKAAPKVIHQMSDEEAEIWVLTGKRNEAE